MNFDTIWALNDDIFHLNYKMEISCDKFHFGLRISSKVSSSLHLLSEQHKLLVHVLAK